MNSTYLVLGAGPIGSAVAKVLLARGDSVRIASRSGRLGPDGATPLTLNAVDTAAVTHAASGTRAVFNCLNPPHYHRWPQEWPPMAAAVLAAARDTGALLVTASNLYPYGEVCAPITAHTPEAPIGRKGLTRARMWAQARAAHERGEVQAVEVRSADYLGPGAFSQLSPSLRWVRQGKRTWVVGALDQPHSWAYTGDVARTLVAVADQPNAWGRLWITPSTSDATAREVLESVARAAGHRHVRAHTIPGLVLRAAGAFAPLARELRETDCERDRPFLTNARETTEELGVRATPWDEVVATLTA